MRDRHPDARWIDETVAALRRWTDTAAVFPTSQLTGGGAVGAAERRLGELHGGRSALLVPSATYGMRAALESLGVRRGDDVLVPELDWPATVAAVRSLGARPVVVDVDPATLTVDPAAAARARTRRTAAAVACHLLGVPADVPALRRALPGVPVVEDCAQALGSRLDGQRVGTLGDLAVFSFGPGKRIDVGEGGAVVAADPGRRDAVLRGATHPLRQVVSGLDAPDPAAFSVRPHPVAAVLLADALDRVDLDGPARRHRRASDRMVRRGAAVLGGDARREVAAPPALDPRVPSGIDGEPVRAVGVHDVRALLSGRTAIRWITVLAAASDAPGPGPAPWTTAEGEEVIT